MLADALEMMWLTLEELPAESTVSILSDAEVLAIADLKMDAAQNQRLGELQDKGKAVGLS